MAANIENRYGKRPDDEVVRDILLALKLDDEVPEERLSIEAHHGVVTIEGNVETMLQKEAAEADAKRVKGVHGVINHIVLRSEFSGATPR